MNNTNIREDKNAVFSYLFLRRFIGILGLSMPFAIVLITALLYSKGTDCKTSNVFIDSLQPSLSHYYYTIGHIIFVGILFLIGSFLITYRGKLYEENILSTIAGLSAFGIAIFPTQFEGFNSKECFQFLSIIHLNDKIPNIVNTLHLLSAAILFISFAYFCFRIFPKYDKQVQHSILTKRKRMFYICGYIILISMIIIAIFSLLDCFKIYSDFKYYMIIFESFALLAFGISWLLSGTKKWL